MTTARKCLGAPAGFEGDCGQPGPHGEHLIYACRYQHLAFLLAVLDGVLPPEDLPPCEVPASFATAVIRRRDGQDVEIYTQTCDAHDREFHTATGYQKSVRLRQPR